MITRERENKEMRYLFNVSSAYGVEADTAENALALLKENLKEYTASWQEFTLVEGEGE
jgi:hypothetical protein